MTFSDFLNLESISRLEPDELPLLYSASLWEHYTDFSALVKSPISALTSPESSLLTYRPQLDQLPSPSISSRSWLVLALDRKDIEEVKLC